VNDGSTDGSGDVCDQYALKDARVRVLHKENTGVSDTRNKALDIAQGDYLIFLDADDYWHKDKLKKQVEALERTNADLVYCSYEIVDETGGKICDDFIVPETTDLEGTLRQNVMNCSTALFKAEVIRKHRFRPDFYHEDFVFWIDLLKDNVRVWGVREVLAAYRVVKGSRASDKLRSAKNRYLVLKDYLKIPFYRRSMIMLSYAVKAVIKYKRK
jgi:teichuronic acid biosynthesis glycosyltransferase TuaG